MDDKNQPSPKTPPQNDDDMLKMTWKANLQLLVVLAFIIGGFIISQKLKVPEEEKGQTNQTKDLLVETQTIAPITKNIQFTRTGNMDVNGQINIIPQISGRVTKVHPNFNNGGTFNKGDILFQIEQADFINAVNIAKAQVEQARTALTLQQAESNAAIEEWRSLNPNRKAPDLVAKKPQLQQANANLKSAQAQLADAQLGLNRTKFNYNFSGRIIDTSIELGQFLQAGQSYGRAYPLNSLEIKVPVEDKVLKFLDVDENNAQNNKVTIRTKYRGENIVIDGTIDRIGSTLDETTRFVDVIVKPNDNQPNALIPGVFVEVDLIGKAVDNVWVLPNEALQGQSDIWIVNDDNTLRQYTPQIITTGDKTSDAIGNGETVKVVMGLLKGVTDGMSVRVANDTASDMPPPPKTDTTPSEPAE